MSGDLAVMGECVEASWSEAGGVARVTLEFRGVEPFTVSIVAGQQAFLIPMGPVLRKATR